MKDHPSRLGTVPPPPPPPRRAALESRAAPKRSYSIRPAENGWIVMAEDVGPMGMVSDGTNIWVAGNPSDLAALIEKLAASQMPSEGATK